MVSLLCGSADTRGLHAAANLDHDDHEHDNDDDDCSAAAASARTRHCLGAAGSQQLRDARYAAGVSAAATACTAVLPG